MEIWKDIPGYEGLYQASDFGNIKSLSRKIKCKNGKLVLFHGKNITPYINNTGYYKVRLHKKNISKTDYVHRIIMKTFKENKNFHVNHMDNNPLNNNINNLEWCTQKENVNHAMKLNLFPKAEKNGMAKLTNEDVIIIKKLKGKLKQTTIALLYGVDKTCINQIMKGKTWKSIEVTNVN